MARTKQGGSLIKRGNRFHLQLQINGRRYKRAIRNLDTGETVTSKTEARKWRGATEDAIREDAASERGVQEIPVGELEQAYLDYLPNYTKRRGNVHVDSSKRARIAPRTLRANVGTLRNFLRFVAKEFPGLQTTRQLTRVQAEAYMASKAKLKDASYNRYLMSLRHVCDVVPYFEENPFGKLQGRSQAEVKKDASPKERFTEDQLLTMLEHATGWIRPAMLVGFHVGLRLGDVVCLRWDMFDGPYLRLTIRKTGKELTAYAPEATAALAKWRGQQLLDWNDAFTNKYIARVLQVHPVTAGKLVEMAGGMPAKVDEQEYACWLQTACRLGVEAGMRASGVEGYAQKRDPLPLDPIPPELDDYVFPRQAERYLGIGRKPDQVNASKQFQRFLEQCCGIQTRDSQGQTVLGFHSLRVTYATMHRIHSGSLERTKERLQHSNSRVTEGYDRRTEDELRAELRAQHVALQFPGRGSEKADSRENDAERRRLQQLAETLPPEKLRAILSALDKSIVCEDGTSE